MKKLLLSWPLRRLTILCLFFCFTDFLAAQSPLPDSPRPGDGKGWLDNGTIKIAVNLNYGGAVTYLSKSNTSVNSINNADHGRQAQLSVYGGPDNFSQSSPNPQWRGLGWNPIEAGDLQNNAPYVLNYGNNGTTIYTKVRPLFWPLVNQQAECYIEKWITLDGNAARVHYRLTNFRSDNSFYYGRAQEIPCLYAPWEFNQHVFYSGNAPFTNGALTTVTSDETGRFEHCSENWMAVQNTSTGQAVGIWSKDFFSFIRNRIGTGNSTGEFGGNCSYLGASPFLILDGTRTYDWDAALVAGTVTDIRNFAAAQPRPASQPNFQFNGSRQGVYYYNLSDSGEPTTELNMTVNNQSDWNISLPDAAYPAAQTSKIYIRAAFSLDNVSTMALGWYRYGEGSGNVHDLGQYVTFPIVNDGQYRTYEVTLSGNSNWTSLIKRLLLFRNPTISGYTNGTIKIDWISYQNQGGCTAPAAPTIAVTGQNTTTCADGSRAVTLTASGCGGTVNWSNGATGSSITVTTPGTYTATCTVNNCTSSNSNAITVSNGTGCGTTSPNPPGSYEGHLDNANCDAISGWVWTYGSDHRVVVEILDGSNGDAVIAEVVASNYRADLQAAGKGDGAHGFSIATPAVVKNGQTHIIKARVKAINYMLITSSTKTVNCPGCSAPAAPSISITGSNTSTCADGSRTVTLTSSGCSGSIQWSTGATTTSINVTTPGTYTATCTVGGCTSSASNAISISNGTGCGSSSPNPAGTYEGHFDGADCSLINGWVWLQNSTHRVVIEILDGSTVIQEMTANSYRSDLQAAGKGDGSYAFWYNTPASLKNGQNHSLSVRVKGISYVLNNSPRVINCSGSPAMLDPLDPSQANHQELQIFPSPALDHIQLVFTLTKNENVSVRILNVNGQTQQVRKISGVKGINRQTILLPAHASGVLLIETIINNKRSVRTFFKK